MKVISANEYEFKEFEILQVQLDNLKVYINDTRRKNELKDRHILGMKNFVNFFIRIKRLVDGMWNDAYTISAFQNRMNKIAKEISEKDSVYEKDWFLEIIDALRSKNLNPGK